MTGHFQFAKHQILEACSSTWSEMTGYEEYIHALNVTLGTSRTLCIRGYLHILVKGVILFRKELYSRVYHSVSFQGVTEINPLAAGVDEVYAGNEVASEPLRTQLCTQTHRYRHIEDSRYG